MGKPSLESTRSRYGSAGSSLFHIVMLLALCGALYFPYLDDTPFFDKGEPREALAVQDIVQRGEWLFPLKRAAAIPSKPPLFHWSAALTYQITGKLDEITIRFPSAFYATLGVLLLYLLGRRLYGGQVGLLAGAILATTMIYGNQALSARVDMTLCFFVTASLVLFYALYRGILARPPWYYLLYILLGIGTLAKGPLGILLPGLVIAAFLVIKKRWDLLFKFALHPGVILTLILAVGWYGFAITRGGEGFVNRQLLSENLHRFFGGSGHSHPIYYYLPYLFSLALPWGMLLPFLFWDTFRKRLMENDEQLFFALWFAAMFGFFSLSAGKRAVYLLPIYPALAMLLAAWIHESVEAVGIRRILFRVVGAIGGLVGALLLVITLGALWNHEPGWFFTPIARLLRPKDRANLLVIQNGLDSFGGLFTAVSFVSSFLWFTLSWSFWRARLRLAALVLVLIGLPFMFISRSVVMPVIAAEKSYREFVIELERRVKPGDKLFLFGGFINSDPLVFYHGGMIEELERPADEIAAAIGSGDAYIIMADQTWKEIQRLRADLPMPLVRSRGKGAEGDAPLVLVRAKFS